MLTLQRCHALFTVKRNQLHWKIDAEHTAPTNEQVNVDGQIYPAPLVVFFMKNKAFPKHPIISPMDNGMYRLRVRHKEREHHIGYVDESTLEKVLQACNEQTIHRAV